VFVLVRRGELGSSHFAPGHKVFGAISRPKILELGSISFRNGIDTPEIGGGHVWSIAGPLLQSVHFSGTFAVCSVLGSVLVRRVV